MERVQIVNIIQLTTKTGVSVPGGSFLGGTPIYTMKISLFSPSFLSAPQNTLKVPVSGA